MHKVFLGIGGNIGNKRQNFEKVFQLLENRIGKVTDSSAIYESPPWGFQSENIFWNQVLIIETKLEAEEILWKILEIEDLFDRKREKERYSSREIDIDILYFNDQFMETKSLIIPHPKIQHRKFVLVPLNEIAPNLKHPLFRLTNLELLENCRDESVIKKIEL